MNNPLIIMKIQIPRWVGSLAGRPVDKVAAIQAAIILAVYGIGYLAERLQQNKNKNKTK